MAYPGLSCSDETPPRLLREAYFSLKDAASAASTAPKSLFQSSGLGSDRSLVFKKKKKGGPGAHGRCGGNRARACTYSDRRGKSKDWHSCGIQPTITYKTITQLHMGGVGSWKAGQMVNGIHSNDKEEATAAVHGCVTHWC